MACISLFSSIFLQSTHTYNSSNKIYCIYNVLGQLRGQLLWFSVGISVFGHSNSDDCLAVMQNCSMIST
jgi:hypothetical protein